MKKIRKAMFETNSSSTHTIIITKDKCDPGPAVDFRIGEFGWEFDTLASINRKASYLYTMACEIYGRDVYQDLYERLAKYGIDCECSVPAVIEHSAYGDYLGNGYVDHASDGSDFVKAIFHNDRRLIRYLFSDESFVITGNDNCEMDEYREMEEQADVDYDHETFYKGN